MKLLQLFTPTLLQRQGNRILALMLVLLHAAFVWGYREPWGPALILAHYGAFLLWQPFFSGFHRLPKVRAVGVLAVGVALAALNSLWAAALWTVLLAGLLAGVAVGLRSPRSAQASGWVCCTCCCCFSFGCCLRASCCPCAVPCTCSYGATAC